MTPHKFLIELGQTSTLWTEDPGYQTRCSGMFSKSAIPGGSDPFISVTFAPSSLGDVATVIYDFKDKDKIGCRDKNSNELYKICDKSAVESKCCEEKQLGNFIVEKDSNIETYRYPDNSFFKYEVKKTGYYCVNAISINGIGRFTAILDWRNPYGELPGNDYPKLPFYGLLSLVYLGIGIIWMALSIIHWREILPVQNYISGVILFLMIEMAFNWGYWENYNIDGASSTFLLCVVSILNAGRNSISFFMLLIVCMGYGVVKPTLGSTMTKCRLLAAAHFIFGVIYAAGTMLVNPDTTGPLVFFIIFPLALTMTAFHIWTLQSLTQTIQTLEIRRQKVKALILHAAILALEMVFVGWMVKYIIFNRLHRYHRVMATDRE
ncbi:hypothetical protein G9A89_010663 [Geosiphon pyriformis]|nr:hypothetical protein G9A89_010663 [Geosiphon pyriformis]